MDARTVATILANVIIKEIPDNQPTIQKALIEVLALCGHDQTLPPGISSSLGDTFLNGQSPIPASPMQSNLTRPRSHKKNSKVKVAKQAKNIIITNGAKKPLNGFVAFRCYYRRIFSTYQQKEASVWLSTLWSTDPHKAKWQLAGAAYSRIRDYIGKERAPLNEYLELIAPLLRIIPRDRYLKVVGFQFDHTTSILTRLNDVDTFTPPNAFTFTTHSVTDIVRHCVHAGYCRPPNSIIAELPDDVVDNEAKSAETILKESAVSGADPRDHAEFDKLFMQNFEAHPTDITNESVADAAIVEDTLLEEVSDVFPFLDQFDQGDSALGAGLNLNVHDEDLTAFAAEVDTADFDLLRFKDWLLSEDLQAPNAYGTLE